MLFQTMHMGFCLGAGCSSAGMQLAKWGIFTTSDKEIVSRIGRIYPEYLPTLLIWCYLPIKAKNLGLLPRLWH